MPRLAWLLLPVIAAGWLVGCRPRPADTSAQPAATAPLLQVVVSIAPQAYFVARVGGDRVPATVLVGPGQNPHTYEPMPAQIAALEQAAVYFTIGLPFEKTLAAKVRAARPDLPVVDLRQGLKLLPATDGEADDGAATGDPDPHTWLDPARVMTMANTIHDELVRLDPAGRPTYDRNARALQADLREVDRRLRAELAPLRGTDILTFHPSFAYFAQAYGLRQVAIETQGKDPDARRLGEIIRQAQARGAKAIFVEPASPSLSAEVVAREIGGVTVELDPLARDYLSNLQRIAAALLQQHQADRVH